MDLIHDTHHGRRYPRFGMMLNSDTGPPTDRIEAIAMINRGAVMMIASVSLAVSVGLAIATTLALVPASRTLSATASVAMSVLSIGVPFIAAVQAVRHAQHEPSGFSRMYARTFATALGLGLVVAVACLIIGFACGARLHNAPAIVGGSLIAQAVAHLVGTGLGLLLARPVIASALTVILPIGLWLLLGVLLPPARDWLTPLPSANRWWSGTLTGEYLPRFAIMVLLWAVLPNAAGVILTGARWKRQPSQ
ncbi:hypothetical protein [Microlunatus sp. Gsoil 973]|uniref:hypothetical protein n=1 Tax=Microlunatus sp. Gsoil 973 TaxID=2672569 RepID=UPI0018A88073|nr:hypothetical protein [Microlunatus sp. Gsoil 973]